MLWPIALLHLTLCRWLERWVIRVESPVSFQIRTDPRRPWVLENREVRLHLEDSRLSRSLDSVDVSQSVLASFFVRAAAGEYDPPRMPCGSGSKRLPVICSDTPTISWSIEHSRSLPLRLDAERRGTPYPTYFAVHETTNRKYAETWWGSEAAAGE